MLYRFDIIFWLQDKKELLPSVKSLQTMGYSLYASMGTADFYNEHGLKVKYNWCVTCNDQFNTSKQIFSASTCTSLLKVNPVDWPYEDTGDHKNGGEQATIADYLSDNMFDLVINLPLRNSGSYRASSFVTQGYKTRRMAVDYSVPLITDIKCSKLLIESIRRLNGMAPPLKTHIDCVSSSRVMRLPGMCNSFTGR